MRWTTASCASKPSFQHLRTPLTAWADLPHSSDENDAPHPHHPPSHPQQVTRVLRSQKGCAAPDMGVSVLLAGASERAASHACASIMWIAGGVAVEQQCRVKVAMQRQLQSGAAERSRKLMQPCDGKVAHQPARADLSVRQIRPAIGGHQPGQPQPLVKMAGHAARG